MSIRAGSNNNQFYKVIRPHTVEVCVRRGTPSAGPGGIAPQVVKCVEYETVKFKKGDVIKAYVPGGNIEAPKPDMIQALNKGSKGASIPADKVKKLDSSATPTNFKARKQGGAVGEAISNTADKATNNPLITGAIIVGIILTIKKVK
jgi:hypothetical protein